MALATKKKPPSSPRKVAAAGLKSAEPWSYLKRNRKDAQRKALSKALYEELDRVIPPGVFAFTLKTSSEGVQILWAVPGEVKQGKAPQNEFDPLEAGKTAIRELQCAEGGAWTGAELLRGYGLTSAVLHKRRASHSIVWWRDALNVFHYPKWQFQGDGAMLVGVKEVLRVFKSPDQWRIMRYFLTPKGQLQDQTPLALLRAGQVEQVLTHAKRHAEENTW